MTFDDLKVISPHADPAWAFALIEEMPRWDITTNDRVAAFMANVVEETRGLTKFEENLNYTHADVLYRTFRTHFADEAEAVEFVGQPGRIANRVYANRMGNGDEASGDGWRYRGRGPAQLTGLDAYHACAGGISQPLVEKPEFLLIPQVGAQSVGWFWRWKGLAGLADADDFEGVCVKWNGGRNGLDERVATYEKLLELLV